MKPWKLAYFNLTRRKVPTAIAFLAIGISVGCSGVLYRLDRLSADRFSALAKGGQALVGAKAGSIEILLGSLNLEGEYPGFLPEKLFRSLRQGVPVHFEDGKDVTPNTLQSVIPFLYFAKYKDYRVIGTDETFLKRPLPEDDMALAEGRWASAPGEVVLGAQVSAREGLKLGDSVAATVWTAETDAKNPVPLQVVGIFSEKSTAWDRGLYSNLTQARQSLAQTGLSAQSIWSADVLNYFLIYVQPGGYAPLQSLINQRTVGQAVRVADARDKLEELTGSGRRLGLFISALVLFLSGLSVAAMMITRFDAMGLQLAVLRSMGYSRGELSAWLLWEGLILGVAACLFGALIDAASFPLIRSMLGTALPDSSVVQVSLFRSIPIWIISIFGTISAVVFPLVRLYRQNVHQSMKGL